MGLVTLALLLAFTAIYLSKSFSKKPAFVTTAVEKITDNLDKVALWGSAYALISAVLTPVLVYSGGDMFVRLISNIMVIIMALPYVSGQLLPKVQEKINPAILDEIKNIVARVSKQEKYIGYAGAAISVILFFVLFR
jgi:hypothetical protein